MKYTIFNMQVLNKLMWLGPLWMFPASSDDDTTSLSSSHFWGKIHQERNTFDHRGRSKALNWPQISK